MSIFQDNTKIPAETGLADRAVSMKENQIGARKDHVPAPRVSDAKTIRDNLLPTGRDARGRVTVLPPALETKRWKPGQSGNPSGFSGRYREMQRMCREFTSVEGTQFLIDVVRDKTEDTRCRIVCMQELNNRGWGKPRDYDPKEDERPEMRFDPSKLSPEQLEHVKQAMLTLAPAMRSVDGPPGDQ